MSKETPTVYYDYKRVKQVRLDLSVEAHSTDVTNFAPEGCAEISCIIDGNCFAASYLDDKDRLKKRVLWPLLAVESIRVDYA